MSSIPKILHYVFLRTSPERGGKPWSLLHHVCLRSAVERIKPAAVLFHCDVEPGGPWWKLTRPLVTLHKTTAPASIFGNPLHHVAHKADVRRLEILMEHGGIYLDIDVFVQRSFDDLLGHRVVMGQEDAGDGIGLTNAVILAEPGAVFLRRWYDAYRSFDGSKWNEHSVSLPAQFATEHPDEITVLAPTAFFWPTWRPEHIEWLFASSEPIPLGQAYANHLWETNAWPWARDMTPGRVRLREGNFQRWAEPLLVGLPDRYGKPSLLLRARRGGRRRVLEALARLQSKLALQS